jgi:hypothetical protein
LLKTGQCERCAEHSRRGAFFLPKASFGNDAMELLAERCRRVPIGELNTMLGASEYPLLKRRPSDYMRDMFYASQPLERVDLGALQCTFRMINAETQLMYASDYPHLGLRLALDHMGPAVPVGKGQAQHCRRHRCADVQAATAQR